MHGHPELDGASLGSLRDEFRSVNGILESSRRLEWIRLGPVPIPIPNPPVRRQALRTHDLHHLLTGFPTDLSSEAQISAWECAAGIGNEPVAWIFCPIGTLGGMLRWPRKTVAAYGWGRGCRTLFGQSLQIVDAMDLATARRWCGVDASRLPPTWRDWVGATRWAAFGIISIVGMPLALLIGRTRTAPVPIGVAAEHGRPFPVDRPPRSRDLPRS